MENKVSDKIRLVLNELAILNQPESKNGKIFYRIEDLRRIRSLSSELYLLCDLASKQGEVFHPEVTTHMEPPVVVSQHVPEPEPQVEMVPEPEPESEQPEMSEPPVTGMPEEAAPEAEGPSSEISIEELVHSHEPAKEVVEAHHHEKPRVTAEHLSAQLSLTRRFEYINNLFGGNAELFMEFLDAVAYSASPDEAMDVFDRKYEENNWKRRQETADDFRRMIRKIF